MHQSYKIPELILGLSFFLFSSIIHLHAANLPPGFAEILVAQDLDPTAMALTPDGRIFITEKNGKILIVENGQLLQDPFLTLDVDNYNERGLSGIAFDPHFEHNGYLYLYYTVKGENHNRISRFTANGNYAVPGSEMVLINIDQLSGTIHNAGSMSFGIDAKLYVSIGDGANGPEAQSLNSLLGKVIRINSDGTIPNDNPFFNQTTGIYRAIYAMGFRNSFSLTIQPGTGRIFASEVGASSWEEINEVLPGKNYGWPIIEGPLNGQTPPANYKEPVFTYSHNDGCAAVGAVFYNPSTLLFPSTYHGKFFFADYCRGYIKYMDPDVPGFTFPFANNINRPLNFLVAPDGTMYYLARAGLGGGSMVDNTASSDGTLWRVFYTGSGKPFVSVNPQSILVSQGEDAKFITAASGEEPLLYQWQQNKIDIPGANDPEFIFTNAMLSDSGSLFRCIVSNTDGADTTLEAELSVTSNQRPEPEIITPIEATTYRAGDTLFFSGRASDNEQGELGATALQWKIDFHHNVHTHPGLIPTSGITQGEYIIPQTGETSDNVWYKIYLTAKDEAGLSKTVTREIFPVKTQFNVSTIPEGLPVYVESDYLQSPVSITSVVGIMRRIEALSSVKEGDSLLLFKEWTDGLKENVRTFVASDDTVTFTAVYDKYPLGNGIGVRGYYYDGFPFDPTFYEPYKFTWIDTTIDFDWGDGSPAPSQVGYDNFLVRWEGFVQPLFDDYYNFHLVGDDGIRLWIDDQMIIDAWVLQGPTEWTGSIELEGGKQYPLKVEFYEEGGGAVCQLSWSSAHIAKSIIPRTQLYPEQTSSTPPGTHQTLPPLIYPNPVREILNVDIRDQANPLKDITIQNSLGQMLIEKSDGFQSDKIQIDVRSLSPGIYMLKYSMKNGVSGVSGFVKE